MPCAEVQVGEPESGETVSGGPQGELPARGHRGMQGCDKDPESTARAGDAGGWLRTGDLATMREDGNFRITGRAGEMLIRGGENIHPREIEEFLHQHPGVADVYVVGVPDERLGGKVLAGSKLRDGATASEQDGREFCRGRIAHCQVPERIRFAAGFPLTVAGKVRKFVMRAQEIALRGLDAAAGGGTA